MKARAVPIVLLVVLALLTRGRLVLADNLTDQGFFTKYVVFADGILKGEPPRARIGDVSPAYLWTIVLFRALGASLHAIRDAQIIALSLAALFCALAAKRLGGWPAAIAAAVLILANRAVFVTATELEPETLILLLNAIAIAALIAWDKPWLAGLFVGLSTVARPTALGTIVLIALWLVWRARSEPMGLMRPMGRMGRLRPALSFVGVALLPVLTILLVNRNLTGDFIIMQPGTHVYEGNNPLATAAAGVMPRIVADMNVENDEPDYLHVAYRIVAARATGQPAIDAKLSNQFWSRKAFAYMRTWPADALELFGWKAILAVHHYDIYDLITTKRKAVELARYPAIPFGVAFVLALAALVLRERKRDLLPVFLFAAATLAALVLFNVSSRQREALLAPLVILGAVGVAEIVRTKIERALLAFGAVVIGSMLLGIEGPPMREDAYNWWSSLQASALYDAAVKARASGDPPQAATLAATSSIFRTAEPPLVSPPTLRAASLQLLQTLDDDDEPRRFDVAIALQKAGAWSESNAVLRTLESYEPRRENRAVSSVSYYRARAALHLGAPPQVIGAFLDAAVTEAPGDPHILALRAVRGDAESLAHLNAVHDPFTRDWVLAHAHRDLGHEPQARALLQGVATKIPEWSRPQRDLR
ncbi:MAG TPA: hypothetical protein VF618_14410 [Thermoanaerobaculia bacterium]